jgi:hypothetical protein
MIAVIFEVTTRTSVAAGAALSLRRQPSTGRETHAGHISRQARHLQKNA